MQEQGQLTNGTTTNTNSNIEALSIQNHSSSDGLQNTQNNQSTSTMFDSLPPCAEEMLCKLIQQTEQYKNQTSTPNLQLFLQDLTTLKNKLQGEEIFSINGQTQLQNAELKASSDNWKSVSDCLVRILKEIRPFDVKKMAELIKAANEASTRVKGQDIILLLGDTGAGKSTTIHFIVGSEMVKDSNGNVNPTTIANPILKAIKIGNNAAKSETRYVSAIPVESKLFQHGSTVLCDTPGFGDSAGPEVDIANGVGLINAIQLANSVKPLILFNQRGIGTRGQGVKKLANILASMLDSVEDCADTFFYAFTRYNKNSSEEVNSIQKLISDVYFEALKAKPQDEVFLTVLKDMYKKVGEVGDKKVQPYIIDPVSDKPENLLEMLSDKKKVIKYPAEMFRSYVTDESRDALQKQVAKDQMAITNALKRNDYALINYKLAQLRYLSLQLDQTYIKDAYTTCAQQAEKHLENIFSQGKELVERTFSDDNALTQDDVSKFQLYLHCLTNATAMRNQHLKEDSISVNSLMGFLDGQISKLVSIINNPNVKTADKRIKTRLDKLGALMKRYKPAEKFYKEAVSSIEARLNKLCEDLTSSIPKQSVPDTISLLMELKIANDNLHQHLSDSVSFSKSINKLTELFTKTVFHDKVDAIIPPADVILSEQEIELLNNKVDELDKALHDSQLKEFVTEETVKLSLHKLVDAIVANFDKLKEKIDALCKTTDEKANPFKSIQKHIIQMQKLRKIPVIDFKTASSFFNTIEAICGHVERAKNNLEKQLEQMLYSDAQKDIGDKLAFRARKLARDIRVLRDAEWLNELRPGVYSNILKDLTEQLSWYAKRLLTQLREIDFSLENPSVAKDIKRILNIFKDALGGLSNVIPSLSQFYTQAVTYLKEHITHIIDDFFEKNSNEKNSTKAIQAQIDKLEKLKIECQSLHPAILHLKENGYESITTLKSDIEKANEVIKANKMELSGKLLKKDEALQEKCTKLDRLRKTVPEEFRNAPEKALFKEIAQLEKELNAIKVGNAEVLKPLSDKLIKLESIQKSYEAKQTGVAESSQVVTLLNKYNLKNLAQIDALVAAKSKQIAEMKAFGVDYVFEQFNIADLSKFITFIDVCKTLPIPDIRKNATKSKDKSVTIALRYWNFVEKQMQNCQTIIASSESAKDKLVDSVFTLGNKLRRLLSDKKKYPETFNVCFGSKDAEESLRGWQTQINSYFISLRAKLIDIWNLKDREALKNELARLQTLARLDSFVSGQENFSSLFNKYNELFYENLSNVASQIASHIKLGQYYKAGIKIDGLEKDKAGQQKRADALALLHDSIHQLVKELSREIIDLDNLFTNADLLQPLVSKLESLTKAKDYCFKLYGKAESNQLSKLYESFINNFQINLQVVLNGHMAQISGAITNNEFLQASKKIKQLESAAAILKTFIIGKQPYENIAQFKKKLSTAANSVSEKFREIGLSEYMFNSPKKLFDKLDEMIKEDQLYQGPRNNLQITITKNIQSELEKAALPTTRVDERHGILSDVKQALQFLPEDIANGAKQQLESTQYKIKTTIEQEQKKLTQALENNNVLIIKTILEDYKKLGRYDKDFSQRLKDHLNSLYEKFTGSLSDEKNSSEITTQLLRVIARYKLLESYMPDLISSFFKSLKSYCITQFNSAYDEIKLSLSTYEVLSDTNKSFPSSVIRAFNQFFVYTDLQTKTDVDQDTNTGIITIIREILPRDFKDKINEIDKTFAAFIAKTIRYCSQSILSTKQMNHLAEGLKNLQLWNDVFTTLRNYSNLVRTMPGTAQSLRGYKSFSSVKHDLTIEITKLLNEFKAITITSDKTDKQQKAKAYFNHFAQNYLLATDVNIHLSSYLGLNLKDEIESSRKALLKQASDTVNEALAFIKKTEPTKTEYNEFNRRYVSLFALKDSFQGHELSQFSSELSKLCDKLQNQVMINVQQLSGLAEKAIGNEAQFSQPLLKMKAIANNVMPLQVIVNKEIDSVLDKLLKNKQKGGAQAIQKLMLYLREEKSGLGAEITDNHECFKGAILSHMNQKTASFGIDYVLANLDGVDSYQDTKNNVDRKVLSSRYNAFNNEYKELVFKHLKSNGADTKSLIANLQQKFRHLQITDLSKWSRNQSDCIPSLLANIFALWTLSNTQYYFNAKGLNHQESYLLQPRAAQVIAIFRLLGIGYNKEITHHTEKGLLWKTDKTIRRQRLFHNLAQIGTGEGKSVTLAVMSSALAILGVDVSVACYSGYLSQRDYQDFYNIFSALNVDKFIHYGTFNEICESIINEAGSIRDRVATTILQGQIAKPETVSRRPKILLIDEVDVFFNKDFYGNVYSPSSSIKHRTIHELINFIWLNKNDNTLLYKVQNSDVFKQCCAQFKGWESLVTEAVKSMIADVRTYQTHNYVCLNDKIGYKEQDGISYNIRYGYKTLFAYYHEYGNGNISEKSLIDNIAITVNCGHFSYAEIPNKFSYIMGVTGTLRNLSSAEKEVIHNVYNIRSYTYVPSVFGSSNLTFTSEKDISFVKDHEYHMELFNEINNALKRSSTGQPDRAVLIFFETKEKLDAFYNSNVLASIKHKVKTMTTADDLTKQEKEKIIKESVNKGCIGLLTKEFGRGTDFKVYNPVVTASGGVHVIQTFLSPQESEETQIKGRTARQGEKGSYSMVLKESELEVFLIYPEDIENLKNVGGKYTFLKSKRDEYFKSLYAESTKFINVINKDHKLTELFIASLNTNKLDEVKKYLLTQNKGPLVSTSRTICLMDATGSMSNLLQKSKNTVYTMFERATKILQDHGMAAKSFEMQFVVYRNYNVKEDMLLQASTWESKPENLRSFMDTIVPAGGWGNEAIEIGLWHVNRESQNGKVSQVILIGDMPANSQVEVGERRANTHHGFGESYWKLTKNYSHPTFYKNELQKLKAKGIPVHAFFVRNAAKKNFQEISTTTSGSSKPLDIHSQQGASQLTNLVTEAVLKDIGGSEKGEALVIAYRKSYVK